MAFYIVWTGANRSSSSSLCSGLLFSSLFYSDSILPSSIGTESSFVTMLRFGRGGVRRAASEQSVSWRTVSDGCCVSKSGVGVSFPLTGRRSRFLSESSSLVSYLLYGYSFASKFRTSA